MKMMKNERKIWLLSPTKKYFVFKKEKVGKHIINFIKTIRLGLNVIYKLLENRILNHRINLETIK